MTEETRRRPFGRAWAAARNRPRKDEQQGSSSGSQANNSGWQASSSGAQAHGNGWQASSSGAQANSNGWQASEVGRRSHQREQHQRPNPRPEQLHSEKDTQVHFHKSFGVMQELFDHRDFATLRAELLANACNAGPGSGPRFLDLGCAPGGFSACLLQDHILGPSSAGFGVSLPNDMGGFPMYFQHDRFCVEFADLLQLESSDLTCPNNFIDLCCADAQNLSNWLFRQRNIRMQYKGVATRSRSLGIWALTVKECELAFSKLRNGGAFIFRFGWRGVGTSDVHPTGEAVEPELLARYLQEEEWYKALTHWLFCVLKSLFKTLRPFKSEYVHQADVSFYMVCRNFDRKKYHQNNWESKLQRAFQELSHSSDESALVAGIQKGINEQTKAEIDSLLDYVGRMRAVGIQSRKKAGHLHGGALNDGRWQKWRAGEEQEQETQQYHPKDREQEMQEWRNKNSSAAEVERHVADQDAGHDRGSVAASQDLEGCEPDWPPDQKDDAAAEDEEDVTSADSDHMNRFPSHAATEPPSFGRSVRKSIAESDDCGEEVCVRISHEFSEEEDETSQIAAEAGAQETPSFSALAVEGEQPADAAGPSAAKPAAAEVERDSVPGESPEEDQRRDGSPDAGLEEPPRGGSDGRDRPTKEEASRVESQRTNNVAKDQPSTWSPAARPQQDLQDFVPTVSFADSSFQEMQYPAAHTGAYLGMYEPQVQGQFSEPLYPNAHTGAFPALHEEQAFAEAAWMPEAAPHALGEEAGTAMFHQGYALESEAYSGHAETGVEVSDWMVVDTMQAGTGPSAEDAGAALWMQAADSWAPVAAVAPLLEVAIPGAAPPISAQISAESARSELPQGQENILAPDAATAAAAASPAEDQAESPPAYIEEFQKKTLEALAERVRKSMAEKESKSAQATQAKVSGAFAELIHDDSDDRGAGSDCSPRSSTESNKKAFSKASKKRAGRTVRERRKVTASAGTPQGGVVATRQRCNMKAWLRQAVGRIQAKADQTSHLGLHLMRFGLFCAMAWSMNSIIYTLLQIFRQNPPLSDGR